MKILYLSFADVSKTNGPAINERQFIPTLHKIIGNDAYFLIQKPEGNLPQNLPIKNIFFFPSSKHRSPINWLYQQYNYPKKVQSIVKEKNIDLLVIRPDIFDFALKNVLKKIKIPYVLKTAGSGEFKVFNRKNTVYRALADKNKENFSWLIHNAKMVDVVSKQQQQSLQKLFNERDKIKWIDNGVDLEQFKKMTVNKGDYSVGQFKPIIGYVGNFPWKRGGMQIIKALPKLKLKYPNIGAIILGGGKGNSKLKDKAEELNVLDNCIFTGQVPFEKVPDYINLMDITISQRYEETQGASELKVRQYLACGKPTIVSPGGANDFVEENKIGKIVDPLDENAFYNAVDYYLSLPTEEYKQISTAARKFAEKHLSYESKVQERLKLYKEIVKND